jgi:hypothetical protein
MRSFYKLIAIAVVIVIGGFSLGMWRVHSGIDRSPVQRGKDIAATEQKQEQETYPKRATEDFRAATGGETRGQSAVPQTVPQVEQETYPRKIRDVFQAATDETASREQLQEGMTALRDEATRLQGNGRQDEAMDLEAKAMELDARERASEAETREREGEPQNR